VYSAATKKGCAKNSRSFRARHRRPRGGVEILATLEPVSLLETAPHAGRHRHVLVAHHCGVEPA
jgi:hypothetical protein